MWVNSMWAMYFSWAPNLPHTFQKSGDLITSAVVVHFKDDFWGKELLQLPECQQVASLIKKSLYGLKVTGKSREKLIP